QDQPHHVRRFFDSLCRGTEAGLVAHLHGIYDDAKKIILTAQQYAQAYGHNYQELETISSQVATPDSPTAASQPADTGGGQNPARVDVPSSIESSNWTLLRKTVWALMATRRLIFVGFGMSDPFLYALFEYVSGDLWDKTAHVHYLITGVSADTNMDPD